MATAVAENLPGLPGGPDLKPEEKSPEQLFKWSTWVHAGPGAEDCEDAEDGTCGDRSHFHAWCRLPNQFQHDEIKEKALAAKARRIRQLRDAETDAYEILEGEIALLARAGETSREVVTSELLSRDFWRDQIEARHDLSEMEEFARIERDRERFQEIRALPEEQQPADELAELERHIERYISELESRFMAHQAPRREALDSLDLNALLDELREMRIETDSMEHFMRTYSMHEWYVGTYKTEGPDSQLRFDSLDQMRRAPQEVIDALRATYQDLETTAQEAVGKGS